MWTLALFYLLIVIVFIIFGLLVYARWHYGSLEKNGIPVVKRDHFLLGSAMMSFKKPGGLLDVELMKKYGPVFGVYHGREPHIVICDPELIRSVTTKYEDHFNSVRDFTTGDPLFNEIVDFLPYEKWKFVRGLLTPVLASSVRMKNAHPAMTESIKDFVKELKNSIKENGHRLDKYSIDEGMFALLTDLIARSQYSINIGKSDENNRFVQIVKEIMASPEGEAPWLATYASVFPFLRKILPNAMINPAPLKEFCTVVKQLMETRRKQNEAEGRSSNQPPRDFLDTGLEWYNNLNTEEYKRLGITDTTIYAQCIMLFFAGQDQISLLIGSVIFFIACNPEIEKKVQQEVDKVFREVEGGVLTHESLSELTYLTACINEATRLHPFVYRTERVCTKDWKDEEKGIKILKGQVVQIAFWAANRNPEYYDDPEKFMPERFMPGKKEKIHPYAFTSFGFGPRSCIGKRLSYEIMILVSAYLLKNFTFLKRNDSQLKFLPSGPFFAGHEPIYVDVKIRESTEE